MSLQKSWQLFIGKSRRYGFARNNYLGKNFTNQIKLSFTMHWAPLIVICEVEFDFYRATIKVFFYKLVVSFQSTQTAGYLC